MSRFQDETSCVRLRSTDVAPKLYSTCRYNSELCAYPTRVRTLYCRPLRSRLRRDSISATANWRRESSSRASRARASGFATWPERASAPAASRPPNLARGSQRHRRQLLEPLGCRRLPGLRAPCCALRVAVLPEPPPEVLATAPALLASSFFVPHALVVQAQQPRLTACNLAPVGAHCRRAAASRAATAAGRGAAAAVRWRRAGQAVPCARCRPRRQPPGRAASRPPRRHLAPSPPPRPSPASASVRAATTRGRSLRGARVEASNLHPLLRWRGRCPLGRGQSWPRLDFVACPADDARGEGSASGRHATPETACHAAAALAPLLLLLLWLWCCFGIPTCAGVGGCHSGGSEPSSDVRSSSSPAASDAAIEWMSSSSPY